MRKIFQLVSYRIFFHQCSWQLLVLFLFLPVLAQAGPVTIASGSDYAVTTWRSEDGLPHDNVHCITQTRDGYLWIGTTMGLTRFDGIKFDLVAPANFPELRENRVVWLFEDSGGVLWVGLENGRLLSYKDGKFTLRISEINKGQAILRMAQDENGELWAQTAEHVLRRLQSDQDAVTFASEPLETVSISGLTSDESGRIWVSTKDGIRFLKDGALQIPVGLEEMQNGPLNLIVRGRRNSIWAIRGRKIWNIRDGKIVNQIESPLEWGQVQTLLETADGKFWLGTGSAKLFCREPTGQVHLLGQSDGIRGAVSVLLEDRENNIWSTSYGGGLSRIRTRLFERHELSQSDSPAHYAFNVCSDPQGNVWARLDANTLINIPAQQVSPTTWATPSLPDNIRALFCDRAGKLWIGGESGKLYRKENGKIELQLDTGNKVNFISALFEDSHSNLWVGFTGGAGAGYLRNGDPKQWQALDKFPVKDVRTVAEAADGSIWFGTYHGGAIRFNHGSYERLKIPDGLPSDYVRCLYADKEGCVWMGTLRGLCRWKDGILTTISVKNGLWNDSISSIVEDGLGNLWMSSFGGVFRAEKHNLNDFADAKIASVQCVGYNRNDGLPGLECPGGFQPAGTRTPNGLIWFPTEAGLVSVNADHLVKNQAVPPVIIEQLLVAGTPVLTDTENHGQEIEPGKHHLEFRFTALSFTSPEKVRFRHKLEGLESDWSPPDDHRSVTYDFVPAGNYTFKVMACNNDGIWNPQAATFTLILYPYFWQSIWFTTFVLLLVGAGLFAGVRAWERKKANVRLERLERQQALERERTRIAKDIHDDAGATLAQIAFLSERIERSRELDEISRLNKRIENAARQTIQSIDEIVWAVSPKHDTLESLANYLSSFAQEHLELAGIRCLLDVLPVLRPLPVNPEIRHNILLTAREALQNVAVHSKATEVRMSLVFSEDVLKITIFDNGRGFDVSHSSSSPSAHGISNMRKRLEEIHGTLSIESEPGKGTLVSFSVKIDQLHLSGIGSSFSQP